MCMLKESWNDVPQRTDADDLEDYVRTLVLPRIATMDTLVFSHLSKKRKDELETVIALSLASRNPKTSLEQHTFIDEIAACRLCHTGEEYVYFGTQLLRRLVKRNPSEWKSLYEHVHDKTFIKKDEDPLIKLMPLYIRSCLEDIVQKLAYENGDDIYWEWMLSEKSWVDNDTEYPGTKYDMRTFVMLEIHHRLQSAMPFKHWSVPIEIYGLKKTDRTLFIP